MQTAMKSTTIRLTDYTVAIVLHHSANSIWTNKLNEFATQQTSTGIDFYKCYLVVDLAHSARLINRRFDAVAIILFLMAFFSTISSHSRWNWPNKYCWIPYVALHLPRSNRALDEKYRYLISGVLMSTINILRELGQNFELRLISHCVLDVQIYVTWLNRDLSESLTFLA